MTNHGTLGLLVFLGACASTLGKPSSYPGSRKNGDDDSSRVTMKSKFIDSPLSDIQWVGGKHKVFVLSEKGVLYRSSDGGTTWKNQQKYLQRNGGGVSPKIKSMHISSDHPTVFFIGQGSDNWVTVDGGESYIKTQEVDLIDVKLHPFNAEWFLGSGNSKGCSKSAPDDDDNEVEKFCYRKLYVTKNSGRTFTEIRNYVVQYQWAPKSDGNEDLVYATVHSVQTGNQKFGFWDQFVDFVATTDYFSTTKVVVEYGNRFIIHGDHNYLFVAAVNPHHETSVNLMISRDIGMDKNFKQAKLPVEVLEHSYTILDTSEGSVFLHVNHNIQSGGASTGNVYISDASGLSFSLSLPFNHRDKGGKCDFEKVEGLEGIYLANFVDVDEKDKETNWEEDNSGTGEKKKSRKNRQHLKQKAKIKTVITFDKGGIWSYLDAPVKDAAGKNTNCKGGGDNGCHLHLHGITDAFGPFYSLESATGIVMATGSLGNHLHDRMGEINTYLSRDAGLTWKEVAKGSHIYEYGDHGGLIVMAFDEGPTNHVLYTWDEGKTWNSLTISDFKFEIENVIIEPSATSLHFVVYGYKSDNDGVLISLDFASLHQSECKGIDAADTDTSDYEFWSPSDGRMNGQCLMGHKVKYTRRKQDAQCYNPEEVERMEEVEHCVCTEEDFECDYGFARSVQGGACQRVKTIDNNDPTTPPADCDKFYTVTKGYRRVAGDTCRGGSAKWDPVQIPCPSRFFGTASHAGKLVLGILFMVVVSLGAITAANKYDLVDEIKGRFFNDYKVVATDDYVFDDDDDDINQSAELVSEFRDMAQDIDSNRRRKKAVVDDDEDEDEDDFDDELDSRSSPGMDLSVSVPTLASPDN